MPRLHQTAKGYMTQKQSGTTGNVSKENGVCISVRDKLG